ncbi:MAG: thiol-disulfide oxidoreductase DCC family protein [Saprospiraceae bacterium]|nr:thiol-disulfide oxidoreductase DCC family protein [Saprospiraceae bacterium]
MTHSDTSTPILLFDGVCNLCNASVQWVLLRDHKAVFKFAALQSETGQALLRRFGLSDKNFDTVVLVDGERIFTRSDAPLEIVRRLGGVWALLFAFKIVPRPIRNAVYDWVARNRYRWFGRREECMLPRPEWKDRFV